MHEFIISENDLIFIYRTDNENNTWVRRELEEKHSVIISRVFVFEQNDLIDKLPESYSQMDEFTYKFRFGTIVGEYFIIPGTRLGIDNDVFIDIKMKLKRTLFAAERNISIFSRLAALLDHKNPVIIGGDREDAIPREVFEEFLRKFPNTYELNRYAEARISDIMSQYLEGIKDARGKYEKYLNKKMSETVNPNINLEVLKEYEIEKYKIIQKEVKEALDAKTNVSEAEWQKLMLPFLLLLFPKYIAVLENVTIHDYYSNPSKKTNRYIDLALIDANGYLDLIEVKKPFDDKILRKTQYRGNSIPTSELSGSIMQAEKYLFHLSKWGAKGEKELSSKYSKMIPSGMNIRISNPKAIIIVGRDQIAGSIMSGSRRLDFEVIKRKYANMVDIITYDDLLRRLTNTIEALSK